MEKPGWLCINCGETLGFMQGGELKPAVPGEFLLTRGPNLVVTCPKCGSVKTFYTSDPVVRAMYQLVDALASALARRVVTLVSEGTLRIPNKD